MARLRTAPRTPRTNAVLIPFSLSSCTGDSAGAFCGVGAGCGRLSQMESGAAERDEKEAGRGLAKIRKRRTVLAIRSSMVRATRTGIGHGTYLWTVVDVVELVELPKQTIAQTITAEATMPPAISVSVDRNIARSSPAGGPGDSCGAAGGGAGAGVAAAAPPEATPPDAAAPPLSPCAKRVG